MTVRELIERLSKCNPDLPVTIPRHDGNGCSTCGYGATFSQVDIDDVLDMETRVEITLD